VLFCPPSLLLKPGTPVEAAMAASGLCWTLGDGWQHGSQGLSGTGTQTSCWYANISQTSYSVNNGQPRAH